MVCSGFFQCDRSGCRGDPDLQFGQRSRGWKQLLFTLETNGTLKAAVIFDYESNASTYSIRVQAKDEFNATVEGNFTVTLTDVYEPSQPNHFVDLNSTVNLEMIWVESGTFTMGSPTNEAGRGTDETETEVTLTKGFTSASTRSPRPSTRR